MYVKIPASYHCPKSEEVCFDLVTGLKEVASRTDFRIIKVL